MQVRSRRCRLVSSCPPGCVSQRRATHAHALCASAVQPSSTALLSTATGCWATCCATLACPTRQAAGSGRGVGGMAFPWHLQCMAQHGGTAAECTCVTAQLPIKWVPSFPMQGAEIVDLGGGTGNFTQVRPAHAGWSSSCCVQRVQSLPQAVGRWRYLCPPLRRASPSASGNHAFEAF